MVFLGISIPFVNFLLCLTIVILGIFYYKKSNNLLALVVASAYVFFAVTHFIDLTEITFIGMTFVLSTLRFIGFSILSSALLRFLTKKWYPILISIIIMFLLTVFTSYITILKNIPTITLLNILFSLQTTTLACFVYKKNADSFALNIGISYAIFSIVHIATVFGFDKSFTAGIIFMRITAYIVVISAILSLLRLELSTFVLKYLTNVKIQTFLILTSMFTLTVLFYFPHLKFNSSDPKPQIYPIKPAITEKQITEVKAGLHIKNFPLFDITTNDFIIDAILWFEFDPHSISIEAVKKFSFEKGTILSLSEPETKIINDKLFTRYKISVKFKSDLDYKLFPLEDHKVNILLTNTFLNPEEVVLKSQNSDLSTKDQIFTGDWLMTGAQVEFGYLKSEITKYDPQKTALYPAILFSLDFKKAGFKKTLIVFVPLFIAFFLSLFSLVINITNIAGILSLSVGSITSLIINLFTIDRMTPNVRYFTLSDLIFNLLLLLVFVIFMINVYIIKQTKTDHPSKHLLILRSYVFLLFIIIVPLITYYLLY
jgi:hypothetical protein